MAYAGKCDRCGGFYDLPFEHGAAIRASMFDMFEDVTGSRDLCPDCMKKLRSFLDGAELNDPGVIENKGQIGFRMKLDPDNHLMNRFMRKE